jgi:hypothetical protein
LDWLIYIYLSIYVHNFYVFVNFSAPDNLCMKLK